MDNKDLKIILSREAQAQHDALPDDAKAELRIIYAAMHQAHAAVLAGQYPTFEDALEAITGTRPVKLVEGQ